MNLIPIHGESYFIVERKGMFNQILRFIYYDEDEYYYHLIHKPEEYYVEISRLHNAMENFLSREKIFVNSVRVKPRVLMVNIDFAGYRDHPYVLYFIRFKGNLRRGENVFEDFYEEEVAEYDYEIYWFFPEKAKVKEVYVSGDFDLVKPNILYIWTRKGDKISGYEKIVFEI